MESAKVVELVDPMHLSRLLYVNPVCVLTVSSEDQSSFNAMTITWLTCVNNQVLKVPVWL